MLLRNVIARNFSLVHAIGSRFSTEGNRLTTLLESHVNEIPTKNALNYQAGERYALQDLSVQARAYGAGLAELKYGSNETLLLVLPNNVERTYLQLAAAFAGCKVATVESVENVDVAACLKATKARGLVVPASLVPKVRAAVPELTLQGLHNEKNPRFFDGYTTHSKPIGSLDFPHLKQVFQTGLAREPRIHLLKHLPMHFPVPNPLNNVKPLAESADFFSVLSPKGEIVKTLSRDALLQQADAVSTKLGLKPDEAVMLCTAGDPLSTMVSLLACISSWSQLIVPDLKNPASIEAFANAEQVVAAIGDLNIPKSAGSRVTKL